MTVYTWAVDKPGDLGNHLRGKTFHRQIPPPFSSTAFRMSFRASFRMSFRMSFLPCGGDNVAFAGQIFPVAAIGLFLRLIQFQVIEFFARFLDAGRGELQLNIRVFEEIDPFVERVADEIGEAFYLDR